MPVQALSGNHELTVHLGDDQLEVLESDIWIPCVSSGLGRGCECAYLLLHDPLPESVLVEYLGQDVRKRYLIPMEQVALVEAYEEGGTLMWRRLPTPLSDVAHVLGVKGKIEQRLGQYYERMENWTVRKSKALSRDFRAGLLENARRKTAEAKARGEIPLTMNERWERLREILSAQEEA